MHELQSFDAPDAQLMERFQQYTTRALGEFALGSSRVVVSSDDLTAISLLE